MVKVTDVKVGDVVCHNGCVARVIEKMNITMANPYPLIRIVGPTIDSTLHPTNVQLMTATKLPQLKVGDKVHINDVPAYDRPQSDGVWLSDMIELIGKEYIVQDLWDHPRFGRVAKLNGWWFRTYHLSEVPQYDMI